MVLVLASVAVLACGCGKTAAPTAQTTEPETTAQAAVPAVDDEDDVALPMDYVGGSTTTAVVASTTAFQKSAIMQELATAPQTPVETAPPAETTSAPAQDEPQTEAPSAAEQPAATTTTTTKPEPTTKAATAELLQSSVLKHIQSGSYTETISAFGKDKSSDDKLYKIVRNGQTAYYITIPAAGLTFKVFPSGGKYYLATPTKYTELTKAQFDAVCKSFGNAFINFSALQYQKTEQVREGLRKYTREDFTLGGKQVSLWYSNGALFKMEMDTGEGTESLPITVSGAANGSYFELGNGLEQVAYSDLESLVQLAGLFFGA